MSLCDQLLAAVEELLLAGLTTASKSTVERIDVSFKEASRMRLLRLGSTLRIANEETSRFTAGSEQFSARRLAFFLGRTWLLATAIRRAAEKDDQNALASLLWTAPTVAVQNLKAVTLGVGKRVVSGAFAAFEFRLRAVEAAPPVEAGEAIVWSCVFPMRAGLDLPAEAFLHLPQKQKFRPSLLLEKKVVEIGPCVIGQQAGAASRLSLTDASEVKAGAGFENWRGLWKWDIARSAARLEQHKPTPIDLDIELQEEVFIDAWEPQPSVPCDEGYDLVPLLTQGLRLDARLDRGPSGVPLREVFTKLAEKKGRPPIYGVMHYEACQFVFQPLSVLCEDGPQYLTVSPDKISQAQLVKAMKFT